MSAEAQLAAGRFYSGIAANKAMPEQFVFSELVQATPRRFPMHHHERNYFFVVIGGDYREGDARKVHEFRPVSAGFHPKHVPHAGESGVRGSRMFTIEFADQFLTQADVVLPHDPVVDFGSREMVWTALRLFRCFRQAETAEKLSFESIACELLQTASSTAIRADFAPVWLRRAVDQLHTNIGSGCSISSLAHNAGVHPVHFARVFRAAKGVSPGEYLQRIRADRACDLLMNSEMPLNEIAIECGFYDQSHMTKLLRRYSGTTPKVLRRLTMV
jgi:AraC family transcriptional regulator